MSPFCYYYHILNNTCPSNIPSSHSFSPESQPRLARATRSTHRSTNLSLVITYTNASRALRHNVPLWRSTPQLHLTNINTSHLFHSTPTERAHRHNVPLWRNVPQLRHTNTYKSRAHRHNVPLWRNEPYMDIIRSFTMSKLRHDEHHELQPTVTLHHYKIYAR